jgi:hypothetical protein
LFGIIKQVFDIEREIVENLDAEVVDSFLLCCQISLRLMKVVVLSGFFAVNLYVYFVLISIIDHK